MVRRTAYRIILVAVLITVTVPVGGAAISTTSPFGLIPRGHEDTVANDVTIVPVRNNIFVIRGGGANVTALIGEDGVVIVDTGSSQMTPKIEAAISELTDKKVTYVVNTHSHHDHREGNARFRAQGAEIIAQENTRKNIIGDGHSPSTDLNIPTITFKNKYEFSYAGEDIRITHIHDAHTDGDAIVQFVKANVIATGDLFVHRGLPFISEGAGATIDGYLAGQRILLTYIDDEAVIIPGHGPTANRQEFAATSDALRVVRNRIAALKAKGLAGRYARLFFPTRNTWGNWRENGIGIDDKQFVHIVHRTLPDQTILASVTGMKHQDLRD